jgi:TRAP-type C4-dicarboxylate transport system substrate-binding protein
MLSKCKEISTLKILFTFLSFLLFFISSAGAVSPKTDSKTLKAVSAWPKTVFEVKYNFLPTIDLIKERVARKYPGQVEIKYLGGDEVIPFRDQVAALKSGTIDMVFTHTGYYTSLIPVLHLINLSELTPREERERGFNEVMNEIHEKKGIHFLGRLGLNLGYGLYLRKPIDKADLKGLRIRVSPTHRKIVEYLGGEPAMIPPADIYIALQRGLLDGFMWPAGIIKEWGWQEHVRYILKPFFYNVTNVILVNLNTWKNLPKPLQELLTVSVADAADKFYKENRERSEKELREMHEKGIVKVISLPPAESKKYLEISRAVMLKLVKEAASEEEIKKVAEVLKITLD